LLALRRLGLGAFLLAATNSALAQEARPQSAAPDVAAAPAPSPVATAPSGEIVIPALTPVVIELLADEGSNISRSGDTFPLRLAEPIAVNGATVIPAGTQGVGEVIHAKKSGGSGSGGELILAADYLEVDGRHLSLRSLDLAATGANKYRTADSLGIAGAATVAPVALIGMLVKGKPITIPKGTIAAAKTAAAFTLAATSSVATAEPAAQRSTGGTTQ
jgi:hypothetical protein